MVAPDADRPGRRVHAIRVRDVLGRASADIDHDGPARLLLGRQDRQRGTQPAEHNVLDVHRDRPHDLRGVSKTVADAVQHEHVEGQLRAFHPLGTHDPLFVVDPEMLTDRVEDLPFRPQVQGPRNLHHLVDVVLGDLPVPPEDGNGSPVPRAPDMSAGNREVNLPDRHAAALLGGREGIANSHDRVFEIDDLPFSHADGGALADSRHHHVIALALLSHESRDLRRADFQGDYGCDSHARNYRISERVFPSGAISISNIEQGISNRTSETRSMRWPVATKTVRCSDASLAMFRPSPPFSGHLNAFLTATLARIPVTELLSRVHASRCKQVV